MMRAIVQHRSLLSARGLRRLSCVCTALLALSAATASAVPLIGTNGNSLVRFDSATPASVTTVTVTGLQPGETLVGIDYRPWTGQLYGVGTTSRVYVLDPLTGVATQAGSSQFLPALSGTSFGTDFSPQADRIRQVSNTEQNLRLNPDTGANSGVDTPLNPAGNIVAVAYNRNDSNVATATTVFGIDSAAGTLVRIGGVDGSPSPNGGTITTIGSLGLGTNLNEAIGFDIATTGVAYATITTTAVSRLYTINLTTGAATLVGTVGNGVTPLLGVTAVVAPAVTAYGVNASGTLYRFNTAFPGSVTEIGPLGIVPNAIDFRPGTQTLYALDVNNATTRLYVVNTTTGAVTPVGPGFPSQVTGQPSGNYNLTGTTIGMDFNPRTLQPDGSLRIRVVGANGTNLRLNSDTGQIAAVDTPLAFAGGDPGTGAPFVEAVAYINNAKATSPSFGTTALYDIDYSKNTLLLQNPPNAGTLNTVGPLGIDPDVSVAFDIYTAGGDDSIAGDFAFAALRRIGDAGYTLYDVNLATGAATNPRTIGGNLTFGPGFAVQPLAPTSTLSINDVSKEEGNSSTTAFEFTITLSQASDVPVVVQYSTADGTATAPGDYTTVSGAITFDPGQTSKTISVAVNGDTTFETNETFTVNLSNASNALLADAQGIGTIVNDEATGLAIITSTNFSNNNAPPGATVRVGSTVTFEYVVTNPSAVSFSNVTVTDDNGTAADPADDFAPPFRNGDANGNSLLDPGENWTYSTTRVAAAGQFSHTGTVSATPQGGGANVSASDPEHQFGIVPTVLANISTRLRVETGARVLIGGFIITGNEDKKVIVRALGPSLDVSGALADPTVEVYNSEGGLIAQNDNWKDAPNRQEIVDSTIPPANDLESAFLGALAPGQYTAIVSGVGDTTGIGLVEVYDLDQTVDSDLGNIATRGFVRTGDDVLIGGLIVTGDAQLKILVRGIGPSLTLADKLEDPTLELVNANGDTLLANDNWRDTQQSEIEATTIAPTNDLESAILTTVQPANYTAILRGRDSTTGIGVVEIYALK